MIAAPIFSLAATTTPSTPDGLVNEGASETGSARQERIRGWRGQSSEIQKKINALDSTAVLSVAMPVLFGVEIKDLSPNFGDPRSGGRTHEGEDIMAVKGTPIVSPTAAVVFRTGTGETEGNYVYTANPGGETFVYMHLDKVGEGVTTGTVLDTGSLIGYVGNTGNAAGGPAHLHFEIRHDRSATDPFPRLTREFTSQEKISYLSKILTQTADPSALGALVVLNFRDIFQAALANNIPLPSVIVEYLASLPVIARVVNVTLPEGDLKLGSSGVLVTNLQQFLIKKAVGSAASRLATAGATGYFGVVTEAALIEYQQALGITPASGYFGPATRARVLNDSTVVISSTTPTSATFTRDLYRNLSGEDVRSLQKILNHYGVIIAESGVGSPGNESDFFGPATEKAVISFQTTHKIVPAAGYVGVITRAALIALD